MSHFIELRILYYCLFITQRKTFATRTSLRVVHVSLYPLGKLNEKIYIFNSVSLIHAPSQMPRVSVLDTICISDKS